MRNDKVKAGAVWVCAACGKTARRQWKDIGNGIGWDESCAMNAVLCNEEKQDGKWMPVEVNP